MTIIEFLTARLDEAEQYAREASRHDEHPLVEGGEHWRWACDEHDEVVDPDPLTQEFIECPQGWLSVSLRSVEQYPYSSIPGEGPHFTLTGTQEVNPAVALHIARHDPAHVLADIAAKRRIIEAHYPDHPNYDIADCHECDHPYPCLTIRLLAEVYADHPDYREEWKA